MITILIDHDIEGYGVILWGTLATTGWLELFPLKSATFQDVDLPINSPDRQVWRFAQQNEMILLTNNRNMESQDSLEQTLRDENASTSLPVLTIGNINRLNEKPYRERCVTKLLEIVLYLENHRGRGRIFIP